MNTDLLPTIAATSSLNALGVMGVYFLHRTRPTAARVLALALPLLAAAVLCLTPSRAGSSHSILGEFAVATCSIFAVWSPGAVTALFAARQSGSSRLIGAIASAGLSAGLGAFLIVAALAFSGILLGECL
jgi:hypothetical protein